MGLLVTLDNFQKRFATHESCLHIRPQLNTQSDAPATALKDAIEESDETPEDGDDSISIYEHPRFCIHLAVLLKKLGLSYLRNLKVRIISLRTPPTDS